MMISTAVTTIPIIHQNIMPISTEELSFSGLYGTVTEGSSVGIGGASSSLLSGFIIAAASAELWFFDTCSACFLGETKLGSLTGRMNFIEAAALKGSTTVTLLFLLLSSLELSCTAEGEEF